MPDDPLNPLLDKLNELLKFVEANASKSLSGPVDPLIEKELAKLEDAVQLFQNITDEEIASRGINPKELLERFEKHPEKYSEGQKRFLRNCRDLGVNAVILRSGLIRAVKAAGYSKMREIGKNTAKSIQKRRNKFKAVDGDSKWKRL